MEKKSKILKIIVRQIQQNSRFKIGRRDLSFAVPPTGTLDQLLPHFVSCNLHFIQPERQGGTGHVRPKFSIHTQNLHPGTKLGGGALCGPKI